MTHNDRRSFFNKEKSPWERKETQSNPRIDRAVSQWHSLSSRHIKEIYDMRDGDYLRIQYQEYYHPVERPATERLSSPA